MDNDELEQFKGDFFRDYIDRYLDRLLDLRNTIKKAKTYDEISVAIEGERQALIEVINETRREREQTDDHDADK